MLIIRSALRWSAVRCVRWDSVCRAWPRLGHPTSLAAAAQEGIGDVHQVEQRIARAVASWAFRSHRREPLIIPVVIGA